MKDEKTNHLLDTLMKCIAACETCGDKCLDEDNVAEMADCIRTDRACADACGITARFVSRNSKYAKEYLDLCRAICEDCEAECDMHDHKHCKVCAKVCRETMEAIDAYNPAAQLA